MRWIVCSLALALGACGGEGEGADADPATATAALAEMAPDVPVFDLQTMRARRLQTKLSAGRGSIGD